MKLETIKGNSNQSLSDMISNLEDYANILEYNCLYMDVSISEWNKTESLESFLDKYDKTFFLVSIDELMSEFFYNDSDYIEKEDYDVARLGIASGLYVMNEGRKRIEKQYVPLSNENEIYKTLEGLIPDVNDFVKKYELFRSWQVNGYEHNAGVLWIDQIVELAFIQDEINKKKVYQEAVKRSLTKVII
jgi:hypothetical protein